jgi:hypothetical protein
LQKREHRGRCLGRGSEGPAATARRALNQRCDQGATGHSGSASLRASG